MGKNFCNRCCTDVSFNTISGSDAFSYDYGRDGAAVEVYGATGPYHVEYRVEGREDDGRFTPLGHPFVKEDAEGAQGWSVPTSAAWPTDC